jgi:hypothetical protein
MSHPDDHVIPYEEAVRRHRALEEQKRKGIIHEVKISDAMSHLLEEPAAQDEGPTPSHLRSIVEREFSEEERSGGEPDESSQGDGDGAFCSLEQRPRED